MAKAERRDSRSPPRRRLPAPRLPAAVDNGGGLAPVTTALLLCLTLEWLHLWHRVTCNRKATCTLLHFEAWRGAILAIELIITTLISMRGSGALINAVPWSLKRTRTALRPLPFDDITKDQQQPDDDAHWKRFVDTAVGPLVHLLLGLLFLYDVPLFLSSAVALPLISTVAFRAKRSLEVDISKVDENKVQEKNRLKVGRAQAVLRLAASVASKTGGWLLDLRLLVGYLTWPVRTVLHKMSPQRFDATPSDGSLEYLVLRPFEIIQDVVQAQTVMLMELMGSNRDLLGLSGVFLLYAAHVAHRSPLKWLAVDRTAPQAHPLRTLCVDVALPSVLGLFGTYLFLKVHCGLPPRSRRGLWTPFDHDECHKHNRTHAASWKLAIFPPNDPEHRPTPGQMPYDKLVAKHLQVRLGLATEWDVYHYYGVSGGVMEKPKKNENASATFAERFKEAENSVHFASIVEFKAPAGASEAAQTSIVLRCEYGTTDDVGVRRSAFHIRTALNLYDHSAVVHTGSTPAAREAFPMVTYLDQLGSNHRFNSTPLRLSGRMCGRLLAECLRRASQPSGKLYNHVRDPSKGEVNCMYYAAKFATPVMAARCLGFFGLAGLWLRGSAFFRSAAELSHRNDLGVLGQAASLVVRLAGLYTMLAIAYLALSISALDANGDGRLDLADLAGLQADLQANVQAGLKLDTDSDGAVSVRELLSGLMSALSLVSVLLVVLGWLALSDAASPVQLGIALTTVKTWLVSDARFGEFNKIALTSQLMLMLAWPFGSLAFRLFGDAQTLQKYVFKGMRWPGGGFKQWAKEGFPQDPGHAAKNALDGIGMNRVRAMWLCVLFPGWKLLWRLVRHAGTFGAAWKQLVPTLKPLLAAALRSPKYLLDVPPIVLKLVLAALVVRLLVRFGVRYLWARGRLLVHKLLKRLHVV